MFSAAPTYALVPKAAPSKFEAAQDVAKTNNNLSDSKKELILDPLAPFISLTCPSESDNSIHSHPDPWVKAGAQLISVLVHRVVLDESQQFLELFWLISFTCSRLLYTVQWDLALKTPWGRWFRSSSRNLEYGWLLASHGIVELEEAVLLHAVGRGVSGRDSKRHPRLQVRSVHEVWTAFFWGEAPADKKQWIHVDLRGPDQQG